MNVFELLHLIGRQSSDMMNEAKVLQSVNRGTMMRWLKKRALRLPAGPLSSAQEADIADCFNMLDEDGSQTLEINELVKAFRMLGLKVRRAYLEKRKSTFWMFLADSQWLYTRKLTAENLYRSVISK